jgi:hypothetical protein
VWHASVAGPTLSPRARRRLAAHALRGVGDPAAEWVEVRPIATHVRRRVTVAEGAEVGPVRDLRGTAEGRARWQAIRFELPARVWPLAREELGADA